MRDRPCRRRRQCFRDAIRTTAAPNCGTSPDWSTGSHSNAGPLGRQHEKVVQPRRDIGEIHERRELGADGMPATLGMSSEIAGPARVRRNPDRRHAIVGSERVTAECTGRFLVGKRSQKKNTQRTLLNDSRGLRRRRVARVALKSRPRLRSRKATAAHIGTPPTRTSLIATSPRLAPVVAADSSSRVRSPAR